MNSLSSLRSETIRSEAASAGWALDPPRLLGASSRIAWHAAVLLGAALMLAASIGLRLEFSQRYDERAAAREQLRVLPRGEALRPLTLGFHHVAADLLWLSIVQVLGEPDVRQADYEWLFHALDVVTTLDPRYVYAYDVGSVALAELAGRVDWSNALLEKGIGANPDAWRLPFQRGFNAFFHQQEYVRAAEYMAMAARLPGRPAYVPELAARLYVEGKQPALALTFLDLMAQQTQDAQVLAVLERRRAEVIVERDLTLLQEAVQRYKVRTGRRPLSFEALIQAGDLTALPVEPFGGAYRFDPERETVGSTTRTNRLRLYHAPDASVLLLR